MVVDVIFGTNFLGDGGGGEVVRESYCCHLFLMGSYLIMGQAIQICCVVDPPPLPLHDLHRRSPSSILSSFIIIRSQYWYFKSYRNEFQLKDDYLPLMDVSGPSTRTDT